MIMDSSDACVDGQVLISLDIHEKFQSFIEFGINVGLEAICKV